MAHCISLTILCAILLLTESLECGRGQPREWEPGEKGVEGVCERWERSGREVGFARRQEPRCTLRKRQNNQRNILQQG